MGFNFLPKEDIECLGECYSQVLQSVSLNLSRAYLNFFADRAKYPRFKSRFRKQSIQYPQQIKQIDSSLKVPGRLVPLRVSQKSTREWNMRGLAESISSRKKSTPRLRDSARREASALGDSDGAFKLSNSIRESAPSLSVDKQLSRADMRGLSESIPRGPKSTR